MASNVGTVNVNLALGRCKDCRHWKPWTTNPKSIRGDCDALYTFSVGNIGTVGTQRECKSDQKERASTHRDFGCIHYEEKP